MQTSLRLSMQFIGVSAGALVAAVAFPGCGGGGGGGEPSFHGGLGDPTVILTGTPGRLSQTPQEANSGNGTTPPPSFDPSVPAENHWFRLDFPFDVQRNSVLDDDPVFIPFSFLNGNITVTDVTGAHVTGMALVNGVDAQGVNRSAQIPHDIDTNGVDHNLGKRVFLYVADTDGNLATKEPFGGSPVSPSTIDTVRVDVNEVSNVSIDATWTFTIGVTADVRPPFVVSVASEIRDPTDPFNPNSSSSTGSFIIKFSEPMVPQSVGHSAELNGFPFDANMPNPATSPPYPPTALTSTVNISVGRLFIPFDCTPVNVNNLADYRLRPLINMPPESLVDILERAFTNNSNVGAMDLAGNHYDGQDTTGDGVPDGENFSVTFSIGPGPAVVNIPVSPEVIYWAPATGDGVGAIDLNGWGIGTNAPGKNAGIRERATLITQPWLDFNGCEVNDGGLNIANGIGLIAHPGDLPPPTDPCTLAPMRSFQHNQYTWPDVTAPVGTGSYPYGPAINASRGELWKDPNDPGNPGTPFPGVNEGSSGFETICRDSNGSPILTGIEFGQVGNIQDMMVGEFLDRAFFDHKNFRTGNSLHVSFWAGGANTTGRNTIADAPTPNPPPTRYWVGLPQINVSFNSVDPTNPTLLIESDEVFTGLRGGPLAGAQSSNAARTNSFVHIKTNPLNPNAADQLIFPGVTGPGNGCLGNGPGGQSASAVYTFSARQQIGNFLYVTDATSRELHAVNSNSMRVITSISLPDPTGLAMSPDLQYLYVTNFADNTFSVVGSDPTSADFHQEIARVRVGAGPKAIAIQPEAEDLFVCNFAGNTVSIVEPKTLTIRKTLDALIDGPYDVEVSERQEIPAPTAHPFGWACGLYFAYVSNFTGNSVIVYESGPDGAQGIGINNIRGSLPLDDSPELLVSPRGICFSPFANPTGLFAGGVFVAHRDEAGFGRVSHIQFTQQAIYGPLPIQPPPGFFIPPGFTDRVFEIVGSWGNTDSSRLAGNVPTDVCLSDLNTLTYQATPSGAPNGGGVGEPPKPEQTGFINSKNHMRLIPNGMTNAWNPDRLYVAYEDKDVIQVLDPAQPGVIVNETDGHARGGTKKLMSYWRQ